MSRIEFSELGQVKVLTNSFPDQAFDDIGIAVDETKFEVLGMDTAKVIVGRLAFVPDSFSVFDVQGSHLLSIDTKAFVTNLRRATWQHYEPAEVTVSLIFQRNSLRTVIKVMEKYDIERTFRDIPTGTKRLPRLASFAGAASYSTEDKTLVRQVFNTFEDSQEVDLEINESEMVFSVPPHRSHNRFRAFSGQCTGVAKSRISRASLDYVSKVHELSGPDRLHIRILDDGFTRFEYECPWGILEYSVTPLVG